MVEITEIAGNLANQILAAPTSGRRTLIALAGPPASGKSTLAAALATVLTDRDRVAQVVPMDGFHLDNRLLEERDLLNRKGAPQTFDAFGFLHLISRMKDEPSVIYPEFDRERDIAIAGAAELLETCDTVIVEGNYLLYDAPVWRDLNALWDIRIRLNVPEEILTGRLIARWKALGLSKETALQKAEGNDLPNARLVNAASLSADITI
ncbi:nucleoside/nucleotide kinase family protein [Shimia sp.]|uniref:nucleoside/nucleotide kinase family protein n=1 Tax=Shimia sp. TaxID=1954381 RepID=UPI003298164F